MIAALLLLVAAALGGVALLVVRARTGDNPPWALAAGHGIFAVAGFVTLTAVATRAGVLPLPTIALTVLVFAVLVGFVMLTKFHASRELIPLGLVATHALAALVGIGLVVAALLLQDRQRGTAENADIHTSSPSGSLSTTPGRTRAPSPSTTPR